MILSFPKSYVAFDLETTDLDVTKADIVEIGAKKVIRDLSGAVTSEETRSWLINLGYDLPAVTTEITGITTEEMKRDGIEARAALLALIEFSAGLPFVGHNLLRYDIPLLLNFGRRHNVEPIAFGYQTRRAVDTAAMYKGMKLEEFQRHDETHAECAKRILDTRVTGLKFNLAHCCEQLKVDATGLKAHRAEGDVEMVDRIYRKMIGLE
jgi:DNA polymerase III alpha subunit (gram-positive type)